jgi:hypothetical protein
MNLNNLFKKNQITLFQIKKKILNEREIHRYNINTKEGD